MGAFSYPRNTPKLLKVMLFLLNRLVVLRFTQAWKGSCDGLFRVMVVHKLLILMKFFCPFNFLDLAFDVHQCLLQVLQGHRSSPSPLMIGGTSAKDNPKIIYASQR